MFKIKNGNQETIDSERLVEGSPQENRDAKCNFVCKHVLKRGWDHLLLYQHSLNILRNPESSEQRNFVAQVVQLAYLASSEIQRGLLHAGGLNLNPYLTEEDIARFQPIKEFIRSMQSMGLSNEQIADTLVYDPEKGIQPTATSDTHTVGLEDVKNLASNDSPTA